MKKKKQYPHQDKYYAGLVEKNLIRRGVICRTEDWNDIRKLGRMILADETLLPRLMAAASNSSSSPADEHSQSEQECPASH